MGNQHPGRSTVVRPEHVLDAYRAALRAGSTPRVEEYVDLLGDCDADLLCRFLEEECDWLQRAGAEICPETYEARFPQHAQAIRQHFTCRTVLPGEREPARIQGSAPEPEGRRASLLLDRIVPLGMDDFELDRRLGKGGQGEVYLARQRSLDRPVAIKFLHGTDIDETQIERFLREARTLAQSHHPQIVTIHGLGQTAEGSFFLVIEYIEGGDLATRLAVSPFPPLDAAQIAMKIADAIGHAHERRIIHRDLKPSNILWDRSRGPVVTDFGLAKDLNSDNHLTLNREVLGTPGYMAPEQIDPEIGEVNERTDVYGLGGILFALLTGQPPYMGTNAESVLRQILSDTPPPSPSAVRSDVPRSLSVVCESCLSKRPADRPASARQLVEALREWIKTTQDLDSSKRSGALRDEPRAADAPSGWIRIVSGGDVGKSCCISKDRFTVGRNAQCDFRIDSARASRFHAQFVLKRNRCYLEDLKSDNGTFVNGQRVKDRIQLNEGDRIHIGDVILQFLSKEPEPADSAEPTTLRGSSFRPDPASPTAATLSDLPLPPETDAAPPSTSVVRPEMTLLSLPVLTAIVLFCLMVPLAAWLVFRR